MGSLCISMSKCFNGKWWLWPSSSQFDGRIQLREPRALGVGGSRCQFEYSTRYTIVDTYVYIYIYVDIDIYVEYMYTCIYRYVYHDRYTCIYLLWLFSKANLAFSPHNLEMSLCRSSVSALHWAPMSACANNCRCWNWHLPDLFFLPANLRLANWLHKVAWAADFPGPSQNCPGSLGMARLKRHVMMCHKIVWRKRRITCMIAVCQC